MPTPLHHINFSSLETLSGSTNGPGPQHVWQAYGEQARVSDLSQDAEDAKMPDVINMHVPQSPASSDYAHHNHDNTNHEGNERDSASVWWTQGNHLVDSSAHAAQAPTFPNLYAVDTASHPLFQGLFDDAGVWRGVRNPDFPRATPPSSTQLYSAYPANDSNNYHHLSRNNAPTLPDVSRASRLAFGGRFDPLSSLWASPPDFSLNLPFDCDRPTPTPDAHHVRDLRTQSSSSVDGIHSRTGDGGLNSRLALAHARAMALMDDALCRESWNSSANTLSPRQPRPLPRGAAPPSTTGPIVDGYANANAANGSIRLNHGMPDDSTPSFSLQATLSFIPNEYPLPSPAVRPFDNAAPAPFQPTTSANDSARDQGAQSEALQ